MINQYFGKHKAKFILNGVCFDVREVIDYPSHQVHVFDPPECPVTKFPEKIPGMATMYTLTFEKEIVSLDPYQIQYVCNNKDFEALLPATGENKIIKVKKGNPSMTSEANNNFGELVNEKTGEDIIDIVMDLVNGRKSASETMDRIAKRCDATYDLAVAVKGASEIIGCLEKGKIYALQVDLSKVGDNINPLIDLLKRVKEEYDIDFIVMDNSTKFAPLPKEEACTVIKQLVDACKNFGKEIERRRMFVDADIAKEFNAAIAAAENFNTHKPTTLSDDTQLDMGDASFGQEQDLLKTIKDQQVVIKQLLGAMKVYEGLIPKERKRLSVYLDACAVGIAAAEKVINS